MKESNNLNYDIEVLNTIILRDTDQLKKYSKINSNWGNKKVINTNKRLSSYLEKLKKIIKS